MEKENGREKWEGEQIKNINLQLKEELKEKIRVNNRVKREYKNEEIKEGKNYRMWEMEGKLKRRTWRLRAKRCVKEENKYKNKTWDKNERQAEKTRK